MRHLPKFSSDPLQGVELGHARLHVPHALRADAALDLPESFIWGSPYRAKLQEQWATLPEKEQVLQAFPEGLLLNGALQTGCRIVSPRREP